MLMIPASLPSRNTGMWRTRWCVISFITRWTLSSADTVVIHVRDSINEPPTAAASGPGSSDEGASFQLNGSTSSDPNGDTLSFTWTLSSTLSFIGTIRETVDLQNAGTATPTVVAQIFSERDLDFLLTVRDTGGLEATATVRVRIRSVPMQVTSISPMHGSPGTLITIRGNNLFDPGTRVFVGVEA